MKKNLSSNECARVLKAMADDTRLLILRSLFDGQKCGTEIARELDLTQPHVAHHLGILKNAGLVDSERTGQKVCYRLHPTVRESMEEKDEKTINLGCCKMVF
ncbi:MAG: metalloregulator ArsR/SmtB family transcription factor [Thermodesulfobacteriota bacterium]|nr:MAG: metalloregulator ArsR/SmtB family transcription factor [Thermodesulfobacteriota bacterium]